MPAPNTRYADWRSGRPMDIAEFSRSRPAPDLRVLTVRGELDISTSGLLQRELADLLDTGARRIEIDLSAVVFMDSSALSALVGAHERARGAGQTVALVHPSPACARVLGITGLDRVFGLS